VPKPFKGPYTKGPTRHFRHRNAFIVLGPFDDSFPAQPPLPIRPRKFSLFAPEDFPGVGGALDDTISARPLPIRPHLVRVFVPEDFAVTASTTPDDSFSARLPQPVRPRLVREFSPIDFTTIACILDDFSATAP
jgi:hypothetical protein